MRLEEEKYFDASSKLGHGARTFNKNEAKEEKNLTINLTNKNLVIRYQS